MKCEVCGKSVTFGNNVSHSNRHTRRDWMPNIQKATLMVAGEKKHVKICTRCLRSHYK